MFGSDSGGTASSVTPALTSLPIQSSVYGLTIPIVRGKTRIQCNLIWYGDFTSIAHTSSQGSGSAGGKAGGSSSNTSTTTYTYTAAVILSILKGQGSIGRVWESKNLYANLAAAGLNQSSGAIGQAVWGWLQTTNPSQALGYSGITYAYAPALSLGGAGSLGNYSFEISSATPSASASGDVSAALVMSDLLQNEAAFPSASLGSVTAWDTYAKAQGLLGSYSFDAQKPASDWLKEALEATNTDCAWTQGKLNFVPLGDKAVTGNGVTYTPNNTPAYDLTEDQFITEGEEDPITVEIKSSEDVYNCIKVEFKDRSNQYNLQIAEAKDAADINARGLRVKSTVQAHSIHDAATAKTYATILLQKELAVRRTFKFKLPWTFALLDPLDLVTVTDPYLGLYRVPVRINTIAELENNNFEIEAEDCPIGMTTASTYGSQAGQGFAHDTNATPGNVTAPAFFEPPIELTATGLEVWAAVSGANANWGGCNVWASIDGLTYKKIGQINGGSRYGSITTALSNVGATVGVLLAGKGGVMLPASAADAAQNQSLCWIGTSAGGEFVNHVGASLTAANAYALSGLIRGAYRSQKVAHGIGQSFVRVDQAVAKSDALDMGMIGQLLHFKFTSFNVYGGGEQLISDVVDYTYTVTGSMATLAPSDVTGLMTSFIGNITSLKWNVVTDALRTIFYEVRLGASWTSSLVLGRTSSANFQAASNGSYWVAAGYVLSNGTVVYSASPSLIVISGATIARNVIATLDEQPAWSGVFSGGAAVSSGQLTLAGTGNFLSLTNVLTEPDIIYYGGASSSGEYQLSPSRAINAGRVAACNVVIGVSASGVSIYDNILNLTDFLGVADLLNDANNQYVSVTPQINIAQADGVYTGWVNYAPGVYSGQYFSARLLLRSTNPQIVPFVTAMRISVDVPDRIDTGLVTTNLAGSSITYANTFNGGNGGSLGAAPSVQITIVDAIAGDDVVLSSQTASGFMVRVLNGGAGVARTVNWLAQGY